MLTNHNGSNGANFFKIKASIQQEHKYVADDFDNTQSFQSSKLFSILSMSDSTIL